MTMTKVHLEDVTRAARQGLALSLLVSALALAAMLASGRPLAIALLGAATLIGQRRLRAGGPSHAAPPGVESTFGRGERQPDAAAARPADALGRG